MISDKFASFFRGWKIINHEGKCYVKDPHDHWANTASGAHRAFDRYSDARQFISQQSKLFGQTINYPDIKKALAIGKIVAIEYASNRDGRTYRHNFKASSRPQLACTLDGKQLIILGGGYRVTERGIEDE